MLRSIAYALYFFLPAYVANTSAALFGAGRPIDLRHDFFDGRRIIGDGVTIRGSAAGIACGITIGSIMAFARAAPGSPEFSSTVTAGVLLSFGAIFGDACGSFIKRRMGKEQGKPVPVLDQLDFAVGALLFSSFAGTLSLEVIAIIILLTPLGHTMITRIGYRMHMKEVPW